MFILPIVAIVLGIMFMVWGTFLARDENTEIGLIVLLFALALMIISSILFVQKSKEASIENTKQVVLEYMYKQDMVTPYVNKTNLYYRLKDNELKDLFNYLTTKEK